MNLEHYGDWTGYVKNKVDLYILGHIDLTHDKDIVEFWWLRNGEMIQDWIMQNGKVMWHGDEEYFASRNEKLEPVSNSGKTVRSVKIKKSMNSGT